MAKKELGQIGYEAYKEAAGGKSLAYGDPIPEWDAITDEMRAAWNAQAEHVALEVLVRSWGNITLELQKRLAAFGYDTGGTDGIYGPATERAMAQWNARSGDAGDTEDYDYAIPVIPGVSHVCMSDYDDVMIGESPTWRPVSHIGCTSCCLSILDAFHKGTEVDVRATVARLKEVGGYNANRDVDWGVVQNVFGLKCQEITLDDALERLKNFEPIICVERTPRGAHFTVALGYEDGTFIVHNPGRRGGDCYAHPDSDATRKSKDIMVRYDALEPV